MRRRAIDTLDQERRAIEERLADAEAIASRIATELTQAEAVSREAEAALAGVLAREAAMRAERRVAEAALDAANTQAARFAADAEKLAHNWPESATVRPNARRSSWRAMPPRTLQGSWPRLNQH